MPNPTPHAFLEANFDILPVHLDAPSVTPVRTLPVLLGRRPRHALPDLAFNAPIPWDDAAPVRWTRVDIEPPSCKQSCSCDTLTTLCFPGVALAPRCIRPTGAHLLHYVCYDRDHQTTWCRRYQHMAHIPILLAGKESDVTYFNCAPQARHEGYCIRPYQRPNLVAESE